MKIVILNLNFYMKKTLVIFLSAIVSVNALGWERETIWPKGKMPDAQSHQIAAMTVESEAQGFKPDKHRVAYLEWFETPPDPLRNGSCMILISGGSYQNCCDMNYIEQWHKALTAEGVQCVNFVYRTPRPVGIEYWRSAWEDGQRAVRIVRSEAEKRGFDPEKIGVISMSAGSHLALLLATSSQTPAYKAVDEIDEIPCHINWAVANAPAYLTTDASVSGTTASRQGYGPDVALDTIFKFDEKTCPVSLHHGGNDPYSPNGSALVYRKLHEMQIPSELHIYPGKGHGAFGLERGIEFMRQMGYLGNQPAPTFVMNRFESDSSRAEYFTQKVWPEGKMPDMREGQCEPLIEWHIPKVKSTDAIQIVWSGGSYEVNGTDSFEVTPVQRFLNDKGMTVVTVTYRTPRPSGLAKYTTAWEDIQRVIRIVRSEASARGLNPDKIGIMGSSAGGHLALLGVTSSRHQAYSPIDSLDRIPCDVQWGVAIYPAYILSDGFDDVNVNRGHGEGIYMAPEFSFDPDTAPMIFIHGDSDVYSSIGSVAVWEKMRSMGIQSELHTLAKCQHGLNAVASPGTGSYNYLDRIWDFLSALVLD